MEAKRSGVHVQSSPERHWHMALSIFLKHTQPYDNLKMLKTKFVWKIEGLDGATKQNIKAQIVEKVSTNEQLQNTEHTAIINKNPTGGADIFISNANKSIVFEGYCHIPQSSAPLVRWTDNPLPDTQF